MDSFDSGRNSKRHAAQHTSIPNPAAASTSRTHTTAGAIGTPQPFNVLQPVSALQSVHKSQPVSKLQPVNPSQPVSTSQPVSALQPVSRLQLVNPSQPVSTLQPVNPSHPVSTLQPLHTSQPVTRSSPTLTEPTLIEPTLFEPRSAVSLLQLPPELLARISRLCAGHNWKYLRSTCKTLHRSAAGPPTVNITPPLMHQNPQPHLLLGRLALAWPDTKNMDVTPPSEEMLSHLDDYSLSALMFCEEVAAVMGKWPQLRSVSAPLSAEIVSQLAGTCQLECLKLQDEIWSIDAYIPDIQTEELYNRLQAAQSGIARRMLRESLSVLVDCRTLRKLALDLQYAQLDDTALKLITVMTQLQELDVEYCEDCNLDKAVSVASITQAITHLTQLTSLRLWLRDADTEGAWDVGPLPRLRVCEIECNTMPDNETGPGAHIIGCVLRPTTFQGCPNLVKLVVDSDNTFSPAMLANLPLLAHLDAQSLALDDNVALMLKSYSQLTYLHVMSLNLSSASSNVELPALRELHTATFQSSVLLRLAMPVLELLWIDDNYCLAMHSFCLRDHPTLNTLNVPEWWLLEQDTTKCEALASLTALKCMNLVTRPFAQLACPCCGMQSAVLTDNKPLAWAAKLTQLWLDTPFWFMYQAWSAEHLSGVLHSLPNLDVLRIGAADQFVDQQVPVVAQALLGAVTNSRAALAKLRVLEVDIDLLFMHEAAGHEGDPGHITSLLVEIAQGYPQLTQVVLMYLREKPFNGLHKRVEFDKVLDVAQEQISAARGKCRLHFAVDVQDFDCYDDLAVLKPTWPVARHDGVGD